MKINTVGNELNQLAEVKDLPGGKDGYLADIGQHMCACVRACVWGWVGGWLWVTVAVAVAVAVVVVVAVAVAVAVACG